MRKLIFIASVFLGMMLASSCEEFKRPDNPDLKRVLILYSVGFNDLSDYLDLDIFQLLSPGLGSYVPELKDDKAVFIVSHTPQYYGSYASETSPVIFRGYYDGKNDEVIRDTVLTMTKGAKLTDKETMEQALSFIKENYPSDEYVMVYSSHGSGWLPQGRYGKFTGSDITLSNSIVPEPANIPPGATPYIDPLPGPPVKSIGQEIRYSDGVKYAYEMNIKDLSESLPMHFSCILLDACLMGGAETAMELASHADKLIISSAEIAAEGFDYAEISNNLLKNFNPQAVAKCYYDNAMALSGWDQSATVAVIECRNIEMLGAVCKTIFGAHRDEFAKVDPSKLQPFFRYGQDYYYDLRDIVVKIGATAEELSEFDGILNQCVTYKAATPVLFSTIKINTFCGLSMFFPMDKHKDLFEYYKGLRWNDASGLVE